MSQPQTHSLPQPAPHQASLKRAYSGYAGQPLVETCNAATVLGSGLLQQKTTFNRLFSVGYRFAATLQRCNSKCAHVCVRVRDHTRAREALQRCSVAVLYIIQSFQRDRYNNTATALQQPKGLVLQSGIANQPQHLVKSLNTLNKGGF